MSVISCAAAGFLVGLGWVSGPPALPARGGPENFVGADRRAEEALIRELSAQFTEAFNRGDAAALARLLTDEARVVEPEGVIVGKPAIEERFAALLDGGAVKMEATIGEVRFVTDDVVIEEGTVTLRGGPEAETNSYMSIWVRPEGTWRIGELRDFAERPEDRTPRQRLETLAWMLGDWIDETDEGLVETVCKWSEDGNALIRNYTLKVASEALMTGTQRIGWDANKRQFRSWAFDSDGGFSEGAWSRAGDGRWLVKASGVLPDGRPVTSTQVYTRVSDHSVRYESYDQTVGGAEVGGEVDVRLVRRPPVPAGTKVESKNVGTREGSSN